MIGPIFYSALTLIGINLFCYGNCFFGLALSIYAVLIIWKFFPKVIYLSLSICVLGALYWTNQQLQVKRPLTMMKAEPKVTHLTIHIDQCRQNGEALEGIGYDEAMRCQVRFRVKQLSNKQKLTLKSNSEMYRIKANYTLKQINATSNFFQFDAAKYWYSRGIVCYYQAHTLTQVTPCHPSILSISWFDWLIKKCHLLFINWFEQLPPQLSAYAESLLLGYIRPDFFEEHPGLEKLGLIHLFSISGFQVQLLMRILTYFCRKMRLLKEQRLILSQFVLIFFWWFASEAQSLIRSVLVVFFENCFELKNFKISRFDLWGISICVSLFLAPGLLCQLGGQLTIVLSFAALWINQTPWWLTGAKFNLAIAPLLLWHTYEWHPISLLANLLLVPLFTYLVLPMVLVGVLASIVRLEGIAVNVDDGLKILQSLIEYLANLPGNVIFGKPSACLVVILITLSLWCLIMKRWQYYAGLIVVYLLTIGWIHWQHGPQIVFVDIGQGDATYVKLDNGENMLVDVGGRLLFGMTKQAQAKASKQSVSPILRYLKANGVQKIDYLILTHKDADHIGNLEAFLRNYHVNHIVVPLGMQEIAQLQTRTIRALVRPVKAPNRLTDGVDIIAPDHQGAGENADSIGLHVTIGMIRIVLTGDLDQAGEQRIIQQFQFDPVTILKLGHHGSRTSSNQQYIDTLKPKLAIVSAGKDNRFGHPHPEVIQRLKSRHIKIYQTAQHGMVCVKPTLSGYQVKFARSSDS